MSASRSLAPSAAFEGTVSRADRSQERSTSFRGSGTSCRMLLRLDGAGALHRQTYRALRDAILAGRLRPGERLASSRELASELGVSRNTVVQAYDRLVAEG